MNGETLDCPHRSGSYYGLPFGQGWLVKNGSSHGTKQALCQACGRRIAVTYATADFGLEAEPAPFELAVRALAEGNAIHATARIVQSDQDTVCAWLNRAARQCRLVVLAHWQHLHVTACQWDELGSVVHTKESHRLTPKLRCESYGDAWVWVAFAPAWRLVVAFVVGKRTQENAHRLLRRVVAVTDAPSPVCTSDHLPADAEARRAAYGQWSPPERQGQRGRYPAPRRMPLPNLLSAQVVKRRARGRVVGVTHTVVLGEGQQVEALRAPSATSMTSNTSFVERDHLRWREHHRRLTRQTIALSKALPWLEKPWWLALADDHVCLPHHSLRQRLPAPEPTRGSGAPRQWRPVTPAMAAGMTDRVWTTAELLGYRIPATVLDKLADLEHVFPDPDSVHHVN
jgi:IS1 family transposase